MLSNNMVLEIIKKYGYDRQNILYILHELQERDAQNYIREEYASLIEENMDIKLSEIYDIVTFHSMFHEKPNGKYIIEICNSGPCFVRKGKKIAECLEDLLGIKMGETTVDGMFTLKYTSCIGACDVAPAFKVGEKIYGNLTKEKVYKIIDEIRGESTWRN